MKEIIKNIITISLVKTSSNTHSSHSSSTNTSIQELGVAPPVVEPSLLWGT
jgi:hypothetical protein